VPRAKTVGSDAPLAARLNLAALILVVVVVGGAIVRRRLPELRLTRVTTPADGETEAANPGSREPLSRDTAAPR
jgi:hypothetical protein